MKQAICCSFCGKPQGSVSKLVLARKGRSRPAICNECLEVCRKILVKSGTAPIVGPSETSPETASKPSQEVSQQKTSPKTYYRIAPQPLEPRQLICSFCDATQKKAHRLIGSHPGLPQAYICGECVTQGETASSTRNKPSLAGWIARKLGRHDTGINHIG